MDNASKALIMVGEILIAMMVVGIIVYSISNFGKFSSNINQKLEQNTQIDFNNTFFKYERRIDITADEIVSVINFAKNTNDSNELYLTNSGYSSQDKSSVYFVDVCIDGNNNSFFNRINSTNFEFMKTEFLNSHSSSTEQNYFSCNVANVSEKKIYETDKDGNIIKDKDGRSKFHIELTPKIKTNSDIQIDNTTNGTGLVKKIVFYKSNYKFDSNTVLFNMQNRDLFVIN